MSDRVSITDPEFHFAESDPIGHHQSNLRLADLAAESLDYSELQHWVQRLNGAQQITLDAKRRGRPVKFCIQPGSVTVNPTSGSVRSSDHDRVVPDACVAMLGRYANGNQAVCISLSVSTSCSSYIPVQQPVSI